MKYKKPVIAGVIALVIIAIAVMFFTSSGKPSDMSENAYTVACKAIEVLDDYISADITASEAYDKISELKGRIDSKSEDEEFKVKTLVLGTDLLLAEQGLGELKNGKGSIDEIKNQRNDIARIAGK